MNQEIKSVVERLRDSTEEAQGHDFKFVADARVEDMQILLAHFYNLEKQMDWLETHRRSYSRPPLRMVMGTQWVIVNEHPFGEKPTLRETALRGIAFTP